MRWKCFRFLQKQDFDIEFNPLSKVSSCAMVQILRNQEKTAPIAYGCPSLVYSLMLIDAVSLQNYMQYIHQDVSIQARMDLKRKIR